MLEAFGLIEEGCTQAIGFIEQCGADRMIAQGDEAVALQAPHQLLAEPGTCLGRAVRVVRQTQFGYSGGHDAQ
jgi:hypothetical protein